MMASVIVVTLVAVLALHKLNYVGIRADDRRRLSVARR